MKATITPIPPPIERMVTLTMTEQEARILMESVGKRSGNEVQAFFGKTGLEKLVYTLHNILSEVLR